MRDGQCFIIFFFFRLLHFLKMATKREVSRAILPFFDHKKYLLFNISIFFFFLVLVWSRIADAIMETYVLEQNHSNCYVNRVAPNEI